jgi:hypothetical protein
MIACCAVGLVYLMLARVVSWPALLARSDTAKTRRDPHASTRGRGTATHQHPAETDLARQAPFNPYVHLRTLAKVVSEYARRRRRRYAVQGTRDSR